MIKCSRLEKDKKNIETNIIKDVRNIFNLIKERNDTAIKDMRNLSRLKK